MICTTAWICASQPASAGFTVFPDRPTFLAATSVTTIDFNDQTPSGTLTGYPGATVTLGGVTFAGNSQLTAASPSFVPGYNLGDSTVLTWQGTSPNRLTVTLPAGTSAVGFDFGSLNAQIFTITLSTGDVFTRTGNSTSSGSPSFFGVTTTAALTGLTIVTASRTPQLDRFSFGSGVGSASVATPLPPTLFALAAGIVPLAGIGRRRTAGESGATGRNDAARGGSVPGPRR